MCESGNNRGGAKAYTHAYAFALEAAMGATAAAGGAPAAAAAAKRANACSGHESAEG